MTMKQLSVRQPLFWNLLDFLMHIIHLSLISFMLTGWVFEATRFPHYVLIWLIFGSWFGLGIFYGFGYCLVTDLQWRVKEKLGNPPSTKFYVKHMIDKVISHDIDETLINHISSYTYYGVFLISNFLFLKNLF